METYNARRFSRVYADKLYGRVVAHPQDFVYGKELVPSVVVKMVAALKLGEANIKGSHAIKDTCKDLKIPFTLSGIAQFLKGDFALTRTAGEDAWDILCPDGVRAEASLSRAEAEDLLEACRREASGITEADEVAQAILDSYAARILA